MDKQVEAGSETLAGIQTFVARYPFSLDAFQLEAIAQLAEGQSVMVAAPTGTGKTLVAEYAIWLAQQRNQRVIYTTPLKALSNQKYRDLRDVYGYDAVGLVTGDIVEHSRASVVIMTTEVYRNMLLEEGGDRFTSDENPIPSSLADVGFVIFDELHYLSDVGRGPVWEEAIICSPKHLQLVGLSATVSNAEDLASWISRVHRPLSLVVHEQRAVPLEHYYFLDGKLHLVEDADGLRIDRFPGVGGEAKLARSMGRGRTFIFDDDDDEEEEEESWEDRRRRGRNGRGGRDNREGNRPGARFHTSNEPQSTEQPARQEAQSSAETDAETPLEAPTTQERVSAKQRPKERPAPEPGEVLSMLRRADLLPCLYFLPGRRVVEEAAMSASRHRFTSPEEEALIREEVGV